MCLQASEFVLCSPSLSDLRLCAFCNTHQQQVTRQNRRLMRLLLTLLPRYYHSDLQSAFLRRLASQTVGEGTGGRSLPVPYKHQPIVISTGWQGFVEGGRQGGVGHIMRCVRWRVYRELFSLHCMSSFSFEVTGGLWKKIRSRCVQMFAHRKNG